MKILGISAFYHDSAAAVLVDGEIIAAAQEERFTRIRHDAAFPSNAIQYCLREAGISLRDFDYIAFYDKPFLKFERLLETYFNHAPAGLPSFLKAMPVWMKEKLLLKKMIRDELKKIAGEKIRTQLLFPEHHLSHAASAFYPSPFEEAAILTIDGVGEWATTTICHGRENKITVLKQIDFPDSPGLLYSAFTYFLGFRVNSGEYKVMGLAPYGNKNSERTERFKKIILTKLIRLYDDGSVSLNEKEFTFSTGLRMVNDERWAEHFGMPRRESESEIRQEHCDLALAIQEVTEEIVLRMARTAKSLTNSENLCLAGGVALNCVANGKLAAAGIFKNIFVQPAAGDAGGSLGAAYASHYIFAGKKRNVSESDEMKGACLGPSFTNEEIEIFLEKKNIRAEKIANEKQLTETVAAAIASGKIIGWFNGRMEFGPRALGNRSILADPRSAEMQLKLNLQIKFRESFRPFAPAVLEEDAHLFFSSGTKSPYMLFTSQVNENLRMALPTNYNSLPLMEKLAVNRSAIPAVTHVDFSARVQTVSKETNPRFYELLLAMKKITGTGMMINTSFNVRNEPIVQSPEDAYNCFLKTGMDVLVLNNWILRK